MPDLMFLELIKAFNGLHLGKGSSVVLLKEPAMVSDKQSAVQRSSTM